MKSSSPGNTQQTTARRFSLFALVNGLACYCIPQLLVWAHYVINGLFIPGRFFFRVNRPNQDMTPLYSSMLLMIALELTGLLIGLYQFNTKYGHSLFGQRASLITRLTTMGVGIIVTSLTAHELGYLVEQLAKSIP